MTKKIFALLITFLLILTVVPTTVLADNSNIYALWGGFEQEKIPKQVMLTSPSNTEMSLESDGVKRSAQSLKIKRKAVGTGDGIQIYFPAIKGETYNISFYAKAEEKATTLIRPIFCYSEGGYQHFTGTKLTKEWQKVSFTFNCTGKDDGGNEVNGEGYLAIRIEGEYQNSVLIDDLSAVPYGKVSADYSSVNDGVAEGNEQDTASSEKLEAAEKEADRWFAEIEAGNIFSDVGGHWAEKVINDLANAGYIDGISDTEYSPNTQVTRAQFIKMVTELCDEKSVYDGRFFDVKADDWFAEALMTADENGFISDSLKVDGKILPDNAITREEAASIAVAAAKKLEAKKRDVVKAKEFTDNTDISDWSKKAVSDAVDLGIIKGYEDESFKPKNTITRAEAAKILANIVDLTHRLYIYVDAKNGNDSNPGTENAPIKTIQKAQSLTRQYAPEMKNDITVFVRGEHYMNEPLKFDENYSGQNGFNIIYTSWDKDNKGVITAAKKYGNFKLHDSTKNIWKTYIGEGTYTRQAYFNDVKGIRARSVGYLKNVTLEKKQYYICENTELLDFKHPEDLELVIHVVFKNSRAKVKKISEPYEGKVRIDLSDYAVKYLPYSTWTYDSSYKRRQSPSYIENAYELLDEAGEWYIDKYEGYLYYIPRNGEDMDTMECKLPIGEKLVDAKGSKAEKPLKNLTFDNLIFEGTTWLRPDEMGAHPDAQNNWVYENSIFWVPDASIYFQKCENITLSNNVFRQLGCTGIEVYDSASYVNIIGNEFYDISGTGISVDSVNMKGGTQDMQHLGGPDQRTEDTWVKFVNFSNNYIHNTGDDFNTGSAVCLGWPRHAKFVHNEISNQPYSGFHQGWGFGGYYGPEKRNTGTIFYDVEISYNYIHDVFNSRVNDGGAIYLLGGSSLECDGLNVEKNNKIIGNYIANSWQGCYIYPDEGSSRLYVKNNVIDDDMIKENEYNFDREVGVKEKRFWYHNHASTIREITTEENWTTVPYAYKNNHMNGTNCVIEPVELVVDQQWPDGAKEVMKSAGIQEEYRDNFNLDGPRVLACDNRWQSLPLNTPTDSGVMILGDYNTKFPLADFDFDFWCSEPGAVTMDENGMLTAHKAGEYECEVVVTVDGNTQMQHMILLCDDATERVSFNVDKINMIAGAEGIVKLTAYSTLGNKTDIYYGAEVKNLRAEDESVATVEVDDDQGVFKVKLLKEGETKILANVEYEGKTYELSVPVKSITYSSSEGANLPYRKVDFRTGWKNTGKKKGDGMMISGSPNHLTQQIIGNELVAFDLEINPGNSWPTIGFCDSDMMGTYGTNDCYMMGFKSDHIELQRFNSGARTMLFGNDKQYNPVGGPGIPNAEGEKVLEYNKRYSIVMGALDTDEGTRIIFNVNGKNVLDYIDNDTLALKSGGYYVVYNPSPGGMIFYPYTGITE